MAINFMSFTNLNNQIKNFAMELKVQERKKTGNLAPEKETTKTPEEEMLERFREEQRNKDYDLEAIKNKLYTGKALTLKEMQYLEKKNPQLYQKAKEIEMERKGYEEKLEKCKTKEDVERLKTSYISSIFSNVQSVMNNSVIPKGAKLGLVMHEKLRMEAIKEATIKFVKSGNYSALPTDAEKQKAEQELAEAEKNELENLGSQENLEMEKPETDDKSQVEDVNKDQEIISSDDKKSDNVKNELKDQLDGIYDKKTKAEVELQDEVRKVKAAKKNPYKKTDGDSYGAFILDSIKKEWRA